jgi:hypothetical protein
MGRSAEWVQEQTGRPPLYSPGRPTQWRREHMVVFWRAIAEGVTSEEAAARAGFSQAAGSRMFREGGGMPTIRFDEPTGRYLSFTEREEIALMRAQDVGVREIARQLGRSPSTISRELRRNAATRGGKLEYRATVAQCIVTGELAVPSERSW